MWQIPKLFCYPPLLHTIIPFLVSDPVSVSVPVPISATAVVSVSAPFLAPDLRSFIHHLPVFRSCFTPSTPSSFQSPSPSPSPPPSLSPSPFLSYLSLFSHVLPIFLSRSVTVPINIPVSVPSRARAPLKFPFPPPCLFPPPFLSPCLSSFACTDTGPCKRSCRVPARSTPCLQIC